MDPKEEIFRGEQAHNILENVIYKESWEKVRESIITAWETSPIRDKEGQHELKLMLKCLKDVQNYMENVVTTGKMAKIQVEKGNFVRNMFRK
jgi:hypothetical protein